MRPWLKVIVNRLAVLLLGAILTIAIIEGGANIYVMISRSAQEPHRGKLDQRALRIVALGESTTAPTMEDGQFVSWPEQLCEKINGWFLKEKIDRKCELYNLAKFGTFSPLLVSDLEHAIRSGAFQQLPDIVVSMIGINDSGVSLRFAEDTIYKNSYFVRFVYWGLANFFCNRCYELSSMSDNRAALYNRGASNPNEDRITCGGEVDRVLNTKKLAARKSPEVIRELYSLVKKTTQSQQEPNSCWTFWMGWLVSVPEDYAKISSDFIKQVSDIVDETIEVAGVRLYQSNRVLSSVCSIALWRYHYDEGKRVCRKLLLKAFKSGVRLSPENIQKLAAVDGKRDREFSEYLFWNHLSVDGDSTKSRWKVARRSYQNIFRLQNEFGFTVLAVQYPGMRLSLLKQNLEGLGSNSQPVYFTSNENFNSIVNDENRSAYFTDMFGRGAGYEFGHTTKKGHELIAENVMTTLVKVYLESKYGKKNQSY